jgi:predicted nucleic acid-binding Zn ribbon protein
MAVKKCQWCGNPNDETAKRCSDCGAYIWPSGRKWQLIWILIFAVFLVCLIIYRYSETPPNSSKVTPFTVHHPAAGGNFPSPPSDGISDYKKSLVEQKAGYTFNGYTLDNRERTILKILLMDDFYGYINGRKSALPHIWRQAFKIHPVTVTADRLQYDYESDEVTGNQKYLKKTLFLSGVVASINRSAGSNHYISFMSSKDTFMGLQASLADGFENYLDSLKKGQMVDLVCHGNGMFMGHPVVDNCAPSTVFAERVVNHYMEFINDYFSKKDRLTQAIILNSVALASFLGDTSDCFGTDNDQYHKCITEIKKVSAEKNFYHSSLEIAANKLKLRLTTPNSK